MTLLSRHRIRNLIPSGLRPSKPPFGHGRSTQYWIFTSERGRNLLWNPRSPTFQAGSFNHCTSPPPWVFKKRKVETDQEWHVCNYKITHSNNHIQPRLPEEKTLAGCCGNVARRRSNIQPTPPVTHWMFPFRVARSRFSAGWQTRTCGSADPGAGKMAEIRLDPSGIWPSR